MDRIPRTGTCSIEGCEKPVKARGWCGAHYKAWRSHGDPSVNKARRAGIAPCSVVGCGKSAGSRGMCSAHYAAFRRYGDPTIRKNSSVVKPCSANGCGNLTTRTYCNAHEARLRRYGDANYKPPKVREGFCTVEGCGRHAHVGELCRFHDRRQRQHGNPSGGRQALSLAQIEFIRANRGKIDALTLATRLGTTVSTIFAVQAGRNWGLIRDASAQPALRDRARLASKGLDDINRGK